MTERSVWTCLVDSDGNPYKNATATKVKIPVNSDADDLRKQIKYDDGDEESRVDRMLLRLLKSIDTSESDNFDEEILEEVVERLNDLNKDNYDDDEFDFDDLPE